MPNKTNSEPESTESQLQRLLGAQAEELRALGDPSFPGIERLPIRPRVASAPVIERP